MDRLRITPAAFLSRPPRESLAVIVVPGNTPGVEVTACLDTVGHRAAVSPRIHFNEVRVPASDILGRPGDGAAICQPALSWTAALIGTACTGVMRAAFDIAFEFAKSDRRPSTVRVIEHQNVGRMLAELRLRLAAVCYLTWKACHQLDITGRRSDALAMMTKIYASELCA